MVFLKVKNGPLLIVTALFALLQLSACQPAAAAAPHQGSETAEPPTSIPTALQTNTTIPTKAPSETDTPVPPAALWLPEYIPAQLKESIQLPAGFTFAKKESDAALRFEAVAAEEIQNPALVPWVYALAAPFPTLSDEASLTDLKAAWLSTPPPGYPLQTILVDDSTAQVFELLWGAPGKTVRVLSAQRILDTAWSQAGSWAILPFEQLEPHWKVILVDGQSPLRKDFSLASYGLTVYFNLSGDLEQSAQLLPGLPVSNRDPNQLTTVVVTGVTALVRGTASLMEGRGMDYPARDIGPWLKEGDILHVSNEVAFAKNCPQPFDWQGLAFCSQKEYIQLLEDVGVDVVELTGDHFKDWGTEAMLYTLDLYKERGWKYYGGGANAQEAMQPALFEHNGNRIAFVGCNAKEEGYASASATEPGAVHCDMDMMERSVKKLVKEGYLPIVTFQHLEYYTYKAHPILQIDFQRMARAGAVIVSGSQAHQPHAFEFNRSALLHYGLGNLFFDQTNQGDAPRTAFIDRHIFYAGRHISTELLTIYLVDYARSRPMTMDERQSLFRNVFEASGWNLFTRGK